MFYSESEQPACKQRFEYMWLMSLLFFCVFFWLNTSSVCQATQKEVLLSTGNWPPFVSRQLHGYGVSTQIVEEAFAHGGYTSQYNFYPWLRALQLAKSQQTRGTYPWQFTEQRKKHFLASTPIIYAHNYFLHRKDFDFSWNKFADLQNLKIGTTLGYAYGEVFRKQASELNLILLDSDNDVTNLTLLMKGRVDIVPMDLHVANQLLESHFPDSRDLITYHPKSLQKQGLSLLISKTQPDAQQLLTAFNRGLDHLSSSGRYEEILSNTPNFPSVSAGIVHNPPWTILGKKGEISGIDIAILKEITNKIGIGISFIPCQEHSCFELGKKGEIDILPNLADTNTQSPFYHLISPPYHNDNIAFYKKIGSPAKVSRFEDLYNYTIAITRNRDTLKQLENDPFLKQQHVSYPEQQLKLLMFDQVDFIAGHEIEMDHTINRSGMKGEFQKLELHIPVKKLHMAFARTSTDHFYIKAFQSALETMMQNGIIQEIIESHITQ